MCILTSRNIKLKQSCDTCQVQIQTDFHLFMEVGHIFVINTFSLKFSLHFKFGEEISKQSKVSLNEPFLGHLAVPCKH